MNSLADEEDLNGPQENSDTTQISSGYLPVRDAIWSRVVGMANRLERIVLERRSSEVTLNSMERQSSNEN